MSEYSEGICGDGVAILKDGTMMTPDEIVADLRRIQQLTEAIENAVREHRYAVLNGREADYISDEIAALAALIKQNNNSRSRYSSIHEALEAGKDTKEVRYRQKETDNAN